MSRTFAMLIALRQSSQDCGFFCSLHCIFQGYDTLGRRSVHFFLKIFGVNSWSFNSDHESFHAVSQLAHVPRPGEMAQDAHCRTSNLLRFPAVPFLGLTKEMLNQQGDVVAPLTQG